MIRDSARSGSFDREQFARLRAADGVVIPTARNGGVSALTTVAVRDTCLTVMSHERELP